MGMLIFYKKFLAFFMIFLMISLTPVFAYTYSIYGSENVDGFIRSGEEFTAKISQPGGAVYVNSSGELYPCECNEGNTSCYCYFGPQYEAGQKTVDITIEQGGSFVTPPPLTYGLDSNAPNVTFTQSLNGNQLTIGYIVTDSSGSSEVECSGVNNFKIFVNNYLQHTEIVNSGTGNCVAMGTLMFPITPEPVVAVSILAQDGVGNNREVPADEELTMDAYPPVILGSFDIMQGDVSLDKIALNNPQVPIVDVVILINEENLVQVRGDLSDFNNVPIQNMGYENKLANCVFDVEINLYRCMFRGINLHPGDELISLTVTAVDAQNNIAVETIEREYEIVNAENDVTHIGPNIENNCDEEGKCFIGKNAVLYTIIAGSADTNFRQMNVPIKISQLTSAYNVANPFTCDNELGDWRCIYTVQVDDTNAGTSKYLYIDHSASDDYGKGLNGLDKSLVVVDMQEPVIAEGSEILLVNNDEVQDYCLTSEDTLTVKLRASDDLSTELKISATSNLTIDQIHRNDCVRGDGGFDCEIDISNFLSIEQDDKLVDIRVFDLAGNYANYTFLIDTCVGDMETVPTLVAVNNIVNRDYRTVSIDRRVASYKYWKTYIPLEFNLPNHARLVSNAHITDYNNLKCFAYDEDLGTDYIYLGDVDAIYFLDKQPESAIISVLIGGQAINSEIDTLDLNCTVDVYGRIGNTYFLKPQVIPFQVELDFEGISLDGPDSIISDKIDEVKKSIKDTNKKLDKYEGVNDLLGAICDYANVIQLTNSVIQGVHALLYALTFIPVIGQLIYTGVFKPFNLVAVPSQVLTTRYVWPPGNMYANWLTMILGPRMPWIGISVKTTCFIYSCKFYDASELVNFASTWATGGFENLNTKGFGGLVQWSASDQDIMFNAFGENFAGLYSTDDLFRTYMAGNNDKFIKMFKVREGLGQYATNEVRDNAYYANMFDTWALDPYKSKYFDDLCIPAIVFNLEKEKQIQCMYINCLESAKESGLSQGVCEEFYKVRACLYVESAEVHEAGHHRFGKYFFKGFMKGAFAALPGAATSVGYQALCFTYYDTLSTKEGLLGDAVQVFCGVGGTLLGISDGLSALNELQNDQNLANTDLSNSCEGITGIGEDDE